MNPLVKWVGGKTQIIGTLVEKFPHQMHEYHEIFVGGGSVLIAVLQNPTIHVGSYYAYDANAQLINMYVQVQRDPIALYDECRRLADTYNSIEALRGLQKPTTHEEAMTSRESYYYWMRTKYNACLDRLLSAALFIFLNKVGWGGLYRVNDKGIYNVPFGGYKNPSIIDRDHVMQLSKLIQPVVFECADFRASIPRAHSNTSNFVYMDPPYVPLNKLSFTKYVAGPMGRQWHEDLFELCHDIGCPFVMSNSCTPLVKDAFQGEQYEVHEFECRRRINRKNPQSIAMEVIIVYK